MNEDDLLTLIQSCILLDNKYEDREYPKGIGAPACLAYANEIRDNFSEEKIKRLGEIISYLDKAFSNDKKVKFLNKNNIPIVILNADIAMKPKNGKDYKITPEMFRDFIFEFAGEDGKSAPSGYKAGSGAGNIKPPKVQQRLYVMLDAMRRKFSEGFNEELPFSKNVDVNALNKQIEITTAEYNVNEAAMQERQKAKQEEKETKKEVDPKTPKDKSDSDKKKPVEKEKTLQDKKE